MKNVVEEKKIPVKNYIILGLIFICGIGIALYLCDWYRVYDDYQRQTPVIRGTLSEITTEELEHYVLENPTTVFYLCTSEDMVCRNYEKDFKKYVEKEDLSDDIVYINLSNIDIQGFVDHFNEKYHYKIKLTSHYPALVIFDEGKVSGIIQGDADEKLTVSKTKQFIEINNIGE